MSNNALVCFAFGKFRGTNPVIGLHVRTVVTELMLSAFDVSNCELTSRWKVAPSLRSVTKIGGRLPSFSLRGKANVHMPASVFHSLL
jgi:hypothetical protein